MNERTDRGRAQSLDFTRVSVYRVNNQNNPRYLGAAVVVLGDLIRIRLKIIHSKRGVPALVFPQQRMPNGIYVDQCTPLGSGVRAAFETVVLPAYQQLVVSPCRDTLTVFPGHVPVLDSHSAHCDCARCTRAWTRFCRGTSA